MSDINLPKGWAATAWEVRYDDARIRVKREWCEQPRELVVSWDVGMRSSNRWRAFDGVTDGEFKSEGDLASDLALAVVKAKKALAEGAKEWAVVAGKIP